MIAGAVCGSKMLINSLMDVNTGGLMLLGPTMDPKVAFELSLRLPQLGLRMREHSHRAQVFAERLAGRGLPVIYPGLRSHPQHELLHRIGNTGEFGAGGLLCLDLETTDRAFRFMEALQDPQHFGYIAVSLGYFDTLLSCSAVSTSSEMPGDVQHRVGLSPGLVRISIGYTGSLEQRWKQFEQVLGTVGWQ
jgi:methionine-gamma-lyase